MVHVARMVFPSSGDVGECYVYTTLIEDGPAGALFVFSTSSFSLYFFLLSFLLFLLIFKLIISLQTQ